MISAAPTVTLKITPANDVYVGTKVTITCTSSDPLTTGFSYTKDGAPTATSVTGAKLELTSAQLTDKGSYKCIHTINGVATPSTAAVTLTVKGKYFTDGS